MSEKIIVTVEQNERIKEFLKVAATKGHVLINHIDGWVADENKVLNTLTVDKMARILYEPGSFEVEKPDYQLGEWVTRINVDTRHPNRKTGRTFKICGKREAAVSDSDLVDHHRKYIRHATPIEITFAKLGREVGQFVEGDIGVSNSGMNWERSYNIEREYRDGNLKGFYPAGTFTKLP